MRKAKISKRSKNSNAVDKSAKSKLAAIQFTKDLNAASDECFKFELNKIKYSIDELIGLGLSSKIPSILNFRKYTDSLYIKNCSGMPVLTYTLKKEYNY